jgi:hypothetical protein
MRRAFFFDKEPPKKSNVGAENSHYVRTECKEVSGLLVRNTTVHERNTGEGKYTAKI